MTAILRKELADYFTSIRVFVLFLLVLLAAAATLYADYQGIRGAGAPGFVFLRLFTTSGETLPSLVSFLALLVPIIGIALGFDAINSERSGGTISRILSQPVYRDSVVNGKFLAGVVTLAVMITTTMLLVAGYGLRMIGVPPSAEEVIRLFIYIVLTVIYGAFWLGLAILFSVTLRRIAASLLLSIAVWLLFSFFIQLIAPAVANAIVAVGQNSAETELIRNAELNMAISRVSPGVLYQEATVVLLLPVVRSLGLLTQAQATYMIPNPLSLGQSMLLVWPHLVILVSLSAVCFAISYILFMRQEIRAT